MESTEGDKIPVGGEITKRCNRIIALERTEKIRKRMFKGHATSRIVSETAEEWGLSERMVWNYVRKVYMELEEQAKITNTPAKMAHRREQLENLYETALLNKDMRTALNAMNLICKIEGAFQPQEHNFNVIHSMSDDEKRKRLDFLQRSRQDYIEAQYEEVE